jgi:TPR repeat protein
MEHRLVLRNPWFQLFAITGVLSAGTTVFNATQRSSPRSQEISNSSTPFDATTSRAIRSAAGTPIGQRNMTAQATPAASVPAPALTTISSPKDAFEDYRQAAERGNPDAQFELGTMYLNGKGTDKDAVKAFNWFTKAGEQGLAKAQLMVALCYKMGLGVKVDDFKAIPWLRKAADAGYPRAQTTLGVCYLEGSGVSPNPYEGVKWLQKSASQGDAEAQEALGVCYATGRGVNRDVKQAFQWFSKAAEQNLPAAQTSVGFCYENGEGVAEDLEKAVERYKRAALQGDETAQVNLGRCYDTGSGVAKDSTEAVKWFRKAAENGYAEAQFYLGNKYLTGEGVERDLATAVLWIRKAADQNYADAQCALGILSSKGIGLPMNSIEAVKWLRKAADQGHKKAIEELRVLEDAGGSSKEVNPNGVSQMRREQAVEHDAIKAIVSSHIQAGNDGNVAAMTSLYGDKVDYLNEGIKTPNGIAQDLPAYFAHWPVRHYKLVSEISIEPVNGNERRVSFAVDFDASDPVTGASREGTVDIVWIMRRLTHSSEFKIISHKQYNRKIPPRTGGH